MESQGPRGRGAIRDRMERATLQAGIGLRAFGTVAGVVAVLLLAPDDGGGLPAAVTVVIVVVNSLAMMPTARWGLRQPGPVPTPLTVHHHIMGDALSMSRSR